LLYHIRGAGFLVFLFTLHTGSDEISISVVESSSLVFSSLRQLTITSPLKSTHNNHIYYILYISKMQFTTILSAITFATGAYAWAQSGNGEWIANNELYGIMPYSGGASKSFPLNLCRDS
jgi:hypothetical protein